MGTTHDSSNSNGGYPPSGISFSHSLGDGSGNNRIVLVGFLVYGVSLGTPTCTYNGTSMTPLGSVTETQYGNTTTLFVYYLLDEDLPASSGSYTVSASASGGWEGVLIASSYTEVKQSPPVYSTDSDQHNPAATGAFSSSVTAQGDSGLVVDFSGVNSSVVTGFTPGSGQTERQDRDYNSAVQVTSEKAYTSSGSVTMSQTPDSNYNIDLQVLIELEDVDEDAMGIVDTSGPYTADGPSSISGSHTCVANTNRKLLVCTTSEENPTRTCNSVTYNSVNLTKIGSEYIHGLNTVSWWYLDDANFPSTPGSYTVQANYNGSLDPGVLFIIELKNAKQGTPYDENSSYNSSNDTLNTTVTTGEDDTWIFGGIVCGNGGSFTPQSGQQELCDISAGGGGMTTAVGSEKIASAGSTGMEWDYNTGANRLLQMVIAVAPASVTEENTVMNGTNF